MSLECLHDGIDCGSALAQLIGVEKVWNLHGTDGGDSEVIL